MTRYSVMLLPRGDEFEVEADQVTTNENYVTFWTEVGGSRKTVATYVRENVVGFRVGGADVWPVQVHYDVPGYAGVARPEGDRPRME